MCPLMKKVIHLIELEAIAAISYAILFVYGIIFDRFSTESSSEIVDAMTLFMYSTLIIDIILILVVLFVCKRTCNLCKSVKK